MSVHLIPAPMPELARGRFSFYPAIIGVKHNEWMLRRATWTEILVANTKTSEELWISRGLIREVSSIEAPVRIVGLAKELEYKEGVVLPHRRAVIEMPRAVNGYGGAVTRPWVSSGPGRVLAIREETGGDSRVRRVLRGSAAIGILACLAVVFVVHDAHLGSRLGLIAATPRLRNLNVEDDYAAVVKKLGTPSDDRWVNTASGQGYRRMWYSRRGITVILAGEVPEAARYAGMLYSDGSLLDAPRPAIMREIR